MRSLIIIIVLVLAGIAGYNFINKPSNDIETISVVDDIAPSEKNETLPSVDESSLKEAATPPLEEAGVISSTDDSEASRHKVRDLMKDYDNCMQQDRPEYHQADAVAGDLVGQTIATCEPILFAMEGALAVNEVNTDLGKNIIQNLRLRATQTLMTLVMQSQEAVEAPTASP